MSLYLIKLRKCGWVLLTIGIIDVGIMIYCIVNKISYSSSFNIFAIIAGVYLIRGNLKAARLTSFFAAFLFSGFTGFLLILPFLLPLDLLTVYAKLHSIYVLLYAVLMPLILYMLMWIYKKLTSPDVIDAMKAAGINISSFWRNPKSGFWVGSGVVVLILIVSLIPFYGEARERAKQKASLEVGPNYKLHISSFNVSYVGGNKYIHATITAYNASAIKNITVDWQE